MSMNTTTSGARLLRLLQLVSPALPIGAFAYSQGLETAVDLGWVHDAKSAERWLGGLCSGALGTLDIAVFARLYKAFSAADEGSAAYWNAFLLANRGAAELRAEDMHLGAALNKVLTTLLPHHKRLPLASPAYATAFAYAAVTFQIERDVAALGFGFAWAEGQVSAAVRLVPLGQSEGQRILMNLTQPLQDSVQRGLELLDHEISNTAPGQVMAAALHETQYARLFRS
jgi:urease accessory protein